MANFDTIKTAIDANIKTNGTQDITGGKMNSILKQIVDATDEQLTELEYDINKKEYSITSDTINIKGIPSVLKKNAELRYSITSDSFSSHSISLYLFRADGTYVFGGSTTDLNIEKSYILGEDFDYIRFYNQKGVGTFSVKLNIYQEGSIIKGLDEKITYVDGRVKNVELFVVGREFTTTSDALNLKGFSSSLKKNAELRYSITSDSFSSHSISLYLFRADGTYVFGGSTTDLNIEKSYILGEDFDYIRFYNQKGVGTFSVKLSILQSDSLREKINDGFAFPYSVKIFRRVGCIGDSYTSGHIQLSGGEVVANNPDYAWPHYMENLTGNKWDNFGASGSTAKWWVSVADSRLYTQVKAEGNKCQGYVIGLMINDQGDWSQYATPVGTIADIATNADTYYAYYYKLIQEVVSVNPSAKIFCNTCPKYADDYSYNQAVRDVVDYCRKKGQNVYLCDLASAKYNNDRFFNNPILQKDFVNGHQTAIGYEYMAECLLRVFSDVINENISDFQNVFQIEFDK